jgi:hypothetical protein
MLLQLAAQPFQLPSPQQKQESEADQRRRAASFAHHAGEIEDNDGKSEARHAQVDALAALRLQSPDYQSNRSQRA